MSCLSVLSAISLEMVTHDGYFHIISHAWRHEGTGKTVLLLFLKNAWDSASGRSIVLFYEKSILLSEQKKE